TVLAIGLKQPVEAEQRGQQRPDPQYRRADAGEKVQIRPDAERHHGDDGEEEQHPDQRAATGAHAKAQIADEERKHQYPLSSGLSAGTPPRCNCFTPSRPSGMWVAATIM